MGLPVFVPRSGCRPQCLSVVKEQPWGTTTTAAATTTIATKCGDSSRVKALMPSLSLFSFFCVAGAGTASATTSYLLVEVVWLVVFVTTSVDYPSRYL